MDKKLAFLLGAVATVAAAGGLKPPHQPLPMLALLSRRGLSVIF